MFDYQKITLEIISPLKEREREVVVRRFGLEGRQRETLESIGKSFGICRERVRQIQERALSKARKLAENYKNLYENFVSYFESQGGLKREDLFYKNFGENFSNEIDFLVSIKKERFFKLKENPDFFSYWTIDFSLTKKLKETIDFLLQKFKEINFPLPFSELENLTKIKPAQLNSFLEVSKRILKNQKGLYGLKEWPEINPKRVIDRVYFLFKDLGKPLHFSEAAQLLKNVNFATCHNELIKDPRFVLIGRGIYALREWGYFPGTVKEVILEILKKANRPLSKEEIIEEVLKQRKVKLSTILQNLASKDLFIKDEEGKYRIKEI